MYPIIDCHCHLYPDTIAQRAADGISKFYNLPMSYDGRVSSYREAAEGKIAHAVICGVAATPKQTESVNSFIADTVRNSGGFFTGLGSLHPQYENIDKEFERIVGLGLVGIKLHADMQGVNMDDPSLDRIYSLCEESGMVLLAHVGDRRYDNSSPERIIRVAKKHPRMKLIAAHLCGWSVWEEAANALAECRHLYTDVSSCLPFLEPERAVELIHLFDSDKVLWGTDYPMWNIAPEIERFKRLELSESEQENILCKNAQKLFGISLKAV